MAVTINLSAENPRELRLMLVDLGRMLEQTSYLETEAEPTVEAEPGIDAETGLAAPADAAPKRGPGRPKKKPAEPAPAAAPAPTETGEKRDAAVDLAMALDTLRAVYDRPGSQPQVTALLAKYGVKKFSDIAPDKGTELLADARKLDTDTQPIF